MKCEKEFKNFLDNTVNLNSTRINTADSSATAITSILLSSDLFGAHFIVAEPQGSIRQRTIIKPTKSGNDFDVDLLVELSPFDGWKAADYLLNLTKEFRALDRYKDKVDTRGKTRCVTIDYESDFHIDIVPTIKTAFGYVIMNKETNQFEPSDGDGYAKWFGQKGQIVGGDHLASVVRLIKYLRDAGGAFEAKSILLTTLIGHMVLTSDKQAAQYVDLPTAFMTLINRLDAFLQTSSRMPQIDNPALPGENFNRHWDQAKYEKFCLKIHETALQTVDAYNELDARKSLEKWQKVFGKAFVGPSTPISGVPVTMYPAVVINGLHLADSSHKQELGDVNILSANSSATVRIDAGLYWGAHDTPLINRRHIGSFSSKTEIPKHHLLKYRAVTNYPRPYDVYWQVVNTGEHAERVGGLRGKIELGGDEKWERSLYTGVHWVECYIVDKATGECVCRSGPFYVGFQA